MICLRKKNANGDVLIDKTGDELLINIDVRKGALNLKDIEVGSDARKHISSLSPELKAIFLSDVKEFYIAVVTYLQDKLPLKNKLLKHLQILHPYVRKEAIKCSLPSIRCLANLLPMVIPKNCVDKVIDEWRLYINDSDISDEWVTISKDIDYFWNKVFTLLDNKTEKYRYPYLTILVKAALTFSHGQGSVERGFSISKRMLSSERASMNLDTIRGLRIIKDALQGRATDVNITQEMIQFYREAHSKYKAQKEKETVIKVKKLEKESQPSNSTSNKKKLQDEISSAQAIIEEGNKKLQTGLKRKSLLEIEMAQALINAGNKKLKMATKEINKKEQC